jgi:hypothetical protein
MEVSDKWAELTLRVITLYQQGLLFKAARLAEEAMTYAESNFDPNHPRVVEALDNMALLCHAEGKYAERLLYVQALVRKRQRPQQSVEVNTRQYLNDLMLLGLSRTKYGEAESFLKRALAIKGKTFRPDHPDLLNSLGNLAELYSLQGKEAEAQSILMSIRSQRISAPENDRLAEPESRRRTPMKPPYHRRDIRFHGQFPTKITGVEFDYSVRGTTKNLSQYGAFIRTKDWKKLEINDQVTVTMFIPSTFSSQNAASGLRAIANIIRIDEKSEGIAVEFISGLRQLEPKMEYEIAGLARYKKLSYYLSNFGDLSISEIIRSYPHGLFVGKSEDILDSSAIFQFKTQHLQERDDINQLERDSLRTNILETRVIEIKKKRDRNNNNVVTIGRSADNDIVLYNKMISKSHAYLEISGEDHSVLLTDLGSANGTFVNGKRMELTEKSELTVGDELSFGPETKLIYLSSEAFYEYLSKSMAYYL